MPPPYELVPPPDDPESELAALETRGRQIAQEVGALQQEAAGLQRRADYLQGVMSERQTKNIDDVIIDDVVDIEGIEPPT